MIGYRMITTYKTSPLSVPIKESEGHSVPRTYDANGTLRNFTTPSKSQRAGARIGRVSHGRVHHDRQDSLSVIVLEYGPGLRVLSSGSKDMTIDEVVRS